MTAALAWLAAATGTAMGASPLLQLGRMLRLRTARDISLSFFTVVTAGQLTWVAYGAALRNPAVIAANGCGALVNAAVVLTACLLRKTAPDP